VRTWLPQPASWRTLTVETQERDPGSMLALYRAALALRRSHDGFRGEAFSWLPSAPDVLEFERSARLRCTVNIGADAVRLDPDRSVLLASAPVVDEALPPDATAWTAPSA
jgi:alpha-glucosidase